MAPVATCRVATHRCQLPSLIEVAERIVVSGFPTPNANLPLSRAVPKSLLLNGTSPSTKPAPLYHWPTAVICVVFTQNAMLKSLPILFVTWTVLFNPLNVRQPPARPLLFQCALLTVPLFPLPETSVATVPFVASSGQ